MIIYICIDLNNSYVSTELSNVTIHLGEWFLIFQKILGKISGTKTMSAYSGKLGIWTFNREFPNSDMF